MSAPQYISLFQFFKIFPDEQSAANYFETSRWPAGVRCPRCDKKETVKAVPNAKPQPYHCKECRKYFSVKVGTVMEASPIPLRTWLAAIYLMTVSRKGVSSCQLARQLDIQQKTAYFLLSRIREAWNTKGNFMLSGVIECDEAYFGGKEKNKHASKKLKEGRGPVGKTAVIAMKERGRNRITAFPIAETDAKTLQNSIKENVVTGSTLYTDEHRSYTGISGYNHETVAHSVGEYVKGMASTNGVESFWALLKRGIYGIYHQVSPKHLNKYCDEFSFRYNARKASVNDKFDYSLENSTRLMYKQLIGKA